MEATECYGTVQNTTGLYVTHRTGRYGMLRDATECYVTHRAFTGAPIDAADPAPFGASASAESTLGRSPTAPENGTLLDATGRYGTYGTLCDAPDTTESYFDTP